MDFSSLAIQLLNGLASASSLFLVSAGLSLIFGVTRIVNFAHGSFFLLGIYIAYSLATFFSNAFGFWSAIVLSAILVGLIGTLIEITLLKRIYKAPELFQLLATFALVLVIKDTVLWLWGPDELLGPRAPGFKGAVMLLDRPFPSYDLFLIVIGPIVLGLLWLLLKKTRWGTLIRAATQDREMVAALGVNQAILFTSVFTIGAMLAGLGGALQLPRESANLDLDIHTIGSAFVVVVVGGMGSIPGAFIAALIISEVKAICVWIGLVNIFGVEVSFSKLTLVVDFLVMAIVLVIRPWGLLGRPQISKPHSSELETSFRIPNQPLKIVGTLLILLLIGLPYFASESPYTIVLVIDLLIATIFSVSLHFIMGPGGMHSFGHAAYFGLGAYIAALLVRYLGISMELVLILAPLLTGIAALIFGWFSVRLSGVYLAMLTLAFAQIAWAVIFQWDSLTGGSNGLTGVWPSQLFKDKIAYFYLTLALVTFVILAIWRILFSSFGFALRAGRDSDMRAEAIGIDVKKIQLIAFIIAGICAGLGGVLFAFSKGSISPEVIHIGRSIDGLVMVLLGGINALTGPIVGAVTFTWLHDVIARSTDYWRAALGLIILFLVLLFPRGISGSLNTIFNRFK
ncbi:MAG: ABC transporter permease [Polynucleobacter sp.]|jgi:branched-chain amino acid transport system permease protein|nr:ABC transporter permease [Polynucleobacter sp.]